jgi:hypothetical protein
MGGSSGTAMPLPLWRAWRCCVAFCVCAVGANVLTVVESARGLPHLWLDVRIGARAASTVYLLRLCWHSDKCVELVVHPSRCHTSQQSGTHNVSRDT